MYITVNPNELIQPLAKVELDNDEYARVSFLEKNENAVVVKIDTILKELTYEPYDTEQNKKIRKFEQGLKDFDSKLKSFLN